MPVPPLVKILTVPLAPADAFSLFTDGLARWWPVAQHSVGGADSVCFMERGIGGRIVERTNDGSETVWGTVSRWQPPERVSFSWHPGRDSEYAQSIDMEFVADGPGATRVTLTHGGWDALGDRAEIMRRNYDTGWDHVFGECYAGAARRMAEPR